MNKTLIFSTLVLSLISSLHAEKSGEDWKTEYFKQNPAADTNQDGELSWSEFHTHKKSGAKKAPAKKAPAKNTPKEKTKAETWKDTYFKKHPEADSNKDGVLSWPEYNKHKEASDF